MQRLNQETYVVEHNPNCPSRFLVRLVGKGAGVIDKKSPAETRDILGYGKTLSQAAKNALKQT